MRRSSPGWGESERGLRGRPAAEAVSEKRILENQELGGARQEEVVDA